MIFLVHNYLIAWLACGAVYKRFRTRMVCDGSPQSISTAVRFASKFDRHDNHEFFIVQLSNVLDELRPQGSGGEGQRPKTTAMVARRMVSSALGIRVNLSKEQKEKERQELETARGVSEPPPPPPPLKAMHYTLHTTSVYTCLTP